MPGSGEAGRCVGVDDSVLDAGTPSYVRPRDSLPLLLRFRG
jgi:hypothetical protein